MKTINIELEDKEHKQLSKLKGKRTWKQCLIAGVNSKFELGEI